jgi:hypothetical protein
MGKKLTDGDAAPGALKVVKASEEQKEKLLRST